MTEVPRAVVTGRRRDWSEIATKPVIAQFEIPVPLTDDDIARVTREFEQAGDGALLGNGEMTNGTTWAVTGSLPPDLDGQIDG